MLLTILINLLDLITFAGFLAGLRICIALARGKDITTGETEEVRRKKSALYARICLCGMAAFIATAVIATLYSY